MATCGLVCTAKLMSGGEAKGTACDATGLVILLTGQPVVLLVPMEFMGMDRISDASRDTSRWLDLLFITEFPFGDRFPGTDLE